MRKSLADRMAANPKRYATMFIALIVAAIMISVALVAVWIGAEFDFGPRYPSEDTPLILVEPGSIAWCEAPDSPYAGMPTDDGYRYDEIAFIWKLTANNSCSYCLGFLANESQQEELSAGSAVTTVPWFSTYSHIEVDELAGDGFFGRSDSVILRNVSSWMEHYFPEEDVIGTVALLLISDTEFASLGEYSFAIEGGKLYSWWSHDLDWHKPWYDPLLD